MSAPVSLQPTYIKGFCLTVDDCIDLGEYLYIGGGPQIAPTTNRPRFATVVVLDERYHGAKVKNRVTPDFVEEIGFGG
ncbi:hypothetical protein BT69DRAFT_1340259 [Atractiella rhizophila]|nr:hypothetical protein BT69DRAFT_1340259 [Atractiella rhizophila]